MRTLRSDPPRTTLSNQPSSACPSASRFARARICGRAPPPSHLPAGDGRRDLPLDTFRFFVEQDLHFFLPDLAAGWRSARLSPGTREMRHFAEELVAVVERENENNRVLLGRLVEMGAADRGGATVPGFRTVAYSGYIVSTAPAAAPRGHDGFLPCTWSYADIGLRLQGASSLTPSTPTGSASSPATSTRS